MERGIHSRATESPESRREGAAGPARPRAGAGARPRVGDRMERGRDDPPRPRGGALRPRPGDRAAGRDRRCAPGGAGARGGRDGDRRRGRRARRARTQRRDAGAAGVRLRARSGPGGRPGGGAGPGAGGRGLMLRIDVVTIFPGMVTAPVSEGIVKRAADAGLVRIAVHDLRDYTDDRHRSVDDAPFGGGPGMVMKAEPFFRAREAVLPRGPGPRDAVVLLSPRGARFEQAAADRYARLERLLLLCGRYEGIDERVGEGVATEEVSLGDFVLTGGEVAALAVIEA